MNWIKPLYVSLIALALTACGGGGKTVDSVQEIPIVSANDQQLVGYWAAEDSASPSFEFFASPTEAPFNISLQTGRIFESGKLVNIFYWKMQTNGLIGLSVVDASCMQRPLSQCPVVQSVAIEAKGSSIFDATWWVRFDQNLDGITDKTTTSRYKQKEIDAAQFSSGELFFTHANNRVFDTPIVGNIVNGNMAIRLDDFQFPITVTANSFASNKRRINFQNSENLSVDIEQEFLTSLGYKTFTVKQWYENVGLSATANNEYTLYYEVHRKVQVPTNIDPSSVQLNAYEKVEKKSTVVALIKSFLPSLPTPLNTKLFINMVEKFDNANAGNELQFFSETEGTLSYSLPFNNVPAEVKAFTWSKTEEGVLTLNFSNTGDIKVRAVQKINGGYQVLYSLPDKNYTNTYRIRDLIYDDLPVIDESILPGRYKFISISPLPNGSHEYDLTFHKDKRVTGVVGGYWFQDVNGDIVSYECTNSFGQMVVHYDECVKAFDNLADFKFVHIRRLKFVFKNGNEFQARYMGSQFTGAANNGNYYYSNFPLTYRWTRMGDEPIESNK